ncbi:MAG: glycosyltransferase family 4 protein [Candidatus Hermodarchaeota archaeon]
MKRRLRITQVVHNFHPIVGGIETYAYNLAKGLVDAGHEVKVYTAHIPGFPAYENLEGIHIHRFYAIARPFSYPFIPGLIPALTRDRCDILHAHINSPMTVDFTAFSSRLVNIPLVITYHADAIISDLATKTPGFRRMLSQVYRLSRHTAAKIAKHLIVTSPTYLEISQFLQRYREKTVIIPAPVNPYYLTPIEDTNQAKANLGFNPKDPLILFVGRLVPYKGLDTLLHAFKQILPQIPSTQLAIVGSGPQLPKLQEICHQLELTNSVHFLGILPRRKLRDTYTACDVFVLPSRSRSEAFGIVLLEAMARAKPVVATNVGGIPYVVNNGKTGILVPPSDQTSLAEAITQLLLNPQTRQQLGQAGYQRVTEYFTRPPITRKLEELYLTLIP